MFDRLPVMFGRYQVRKLLGKGGMGAVYLARDTQLDRHVALKVPRISPDGEPRVLDRFFREARAAAMLQHANICAVHDVGEQDGIFYITMAYIEGCPLSELLSRSGKTVSTRQAALLVRKIALALAEAHRRKVVHRDLKPGNIMLTKKGEPVVMDFGLARRSGANDAQLTQSGMLMGTPAYMSPEQAKGAADDMGAACDIYSLGVILYELLAGRRPFEGDTLAVLSQVLLNEPQPPSHHRPQVDDQIEAICLKAMAKRPASRHASMTELAGELAAYLKATDPANKTAFPVLEPLAPDPMLADLVPDELVVPLEPTRPPRVPVSRSLRKAPPPRHQPMRGHLIAGAIGLGALIVAGIVTGLVMMTRTSHGTIQIKLSDPLAQVQVQVDGIEVSLDGIDRPLHLEVGEHNLVVTGANFETVNRSFTVRNGDNPVLDVELRKTVRPVLSSAPHAGATAPPSASSSGAVPRTSPQPEKTPPVAKSTASPDTPAAGAAKKNANTSELPRNQWITIDENTPANSWVWTKNRRGDQLKWDHGALTLENRGMAFPSIRGRDISFRAQVNFIEGNNMALTVRSNGKGEHVYALFDRSAQNGPSDKKGVFVAVLDTGASKWIPLTSDFFEFRVNAIASEVTIQVNGQTLVTHRTQLLDAGHVEITAYDAKGIFKDLEVKILDK